MPTRLIAALSLALASTPALADTLISNVNGIQIGADGKLQRFGSLLIGEDGRVVSVMKAPHPRMSRFDRLVNGEGRTLLPGLIDAHGHVTQLGLTTMEISLNGIASLEDLKAKLARFAAEHSSPRWIVGRGWNEEIWADKRIPKAADLDAVASDRPVWLYRVDGHGAVANSAAMREAGILRNTAAPPGGHIERDEAGKPTGFFVDTARQLVEAKIPPLPPADYDSAELAGQRILLSNGITAVAHMRTTVDDWSSMIRLGAGGRLQIRIMAYAYGLDALDRILGSKPTGWLFGDRLRMTGVKFYSDGALGSRGAWLKQPYSDAPKTSGLSLHTDAELNTAASRAAKNGFQVAVHAIGDAANAQAIRLFEALAKTYSGDRRWRIEHAQVIDPVDIPRLAPAGIIASMQPIHQVSDRTMAEARLGPDRLAGAYAWQTIARSRARLAFGSDFPFDSPNPFHGIAAAISRQDASGAPPAGWRPEERVSFEKALAGFSLDAAYAGFAERQIGSLEPGKWADFILIDRDVSRVPAQQIWDTQVIETWVAGEKVWERTASGAPERGK